MSNFLDNLITKALSPKTVIQPRLASLFEPSRIIDGPLNWYASNSNRRDKKASEPETEYPHEHLPPARPSEHRSSNMPSAAPYVEHHSDETVETEADLTPGPPSRILEEPSMKASEQNVDSEPPVPVTPPEVRFRAVPAPGDTGEGRQPASIQATRLEDPTVRRTEPQSQYRTTILGQQPEMPPVKPKVHEFHEATTDSAPANTVQVTIGRIEVRAVPPPARPTRKKRSASPVMTLDKYLRLRTREGGQ